MDSVIAAFQKIKWHYGDRDDRARAELTERIAARARKRDVLTYGELVEGVRFQLANVNNGSPFYIGGAEWTELDRALLGDFLGYISMESYEAGRFMASAVVVSKTTREPSEGFRALMRQLGLLRSSNTDTAVLLWSTELTKAYDWYANH
jgi:hypothetical protein